ncbi:PAS domain-containing protein [Sneathiella sp.]|jgi:hypothetical protein|uniref:PAS domain-containing protein n=1 Tax=Sneathiella sp. TaxID=1964365 RepID=UPI0039E40CB1
MDDVLHHSYEKTKQVRAEVRDPRIVELLDYYLEIHPKDQMPSRRVFDPFHLPRLLSHLTLVDVERDPYRFKFRVMGSTITDNMELEGTGKYLDEIFPGIEEQYPYLDRVTVAENSCPVHRLGQPSLSFRTDFANLERVHLPLASDGKTVDMILSMFIYNAE